jgi:hypothetical protein
VAGGTITLPAVAHDKTSGKSAAMESPSGGMLLHCLGGFKTQYAFEAPHAGNYVLSVRVATVQSGQKFLISTHADKVPAGIAVPYTVGMWQQTEPVVVTLDKGKNILYFELSPDSRGVTIKDFTLKQAAGSNTR